MQTSQSSDPPARQTPQRGGNSRSSATRDARSRSVGIVAEYSAEIDERSFYVHLPVSFEGRMAEKFRAQKENDVPKVNVRLFAGLHDTIGKSDATLEMRDGATTGQ